MWVALLVTYKLISDRLSIHWLKIFILGSCFINCSLEAFYIMTSLLAWEEKWSPPTKFSIVSISGFHTKYTPFIKSLWYTNSSELVFQCCKSCKFESYHLYFYIFNSFKLAEIKIIVMCIHVLNDSCCFLSWLFHPTATTVLQRAWHCRLLPCLHYTVQHLASWEPVCKPHLVHFDVRILYIPCHSCHWWYAFSVWCLLNPAMIAQHLRSMKAKTFFIPKGWKFFLSLFIALLRSDGGFHVSLSLPITLFLDKLLWPMSKCLSYPSVELITLRSEIKFCVFHIFIPEQKKMLRRGRLNKTQKQQNHVLQVVSPIIHSLLIISHLHPSWQLVKWNFSMT